jgi:hypothetical protein
MVDRSAWPAGVVPVDVHTISKLGVDNQNHLYWDGSPIITSTSYRFTRFQKIIAICVTLATMAGAIGSAAQGWGVYNEWACKVRPGWPSLCQK